MVVDDHTWMLKLVLGAVLSVKILQALNNGIAQGRR